LTDVLAELRTWQGLRDHLRCLYPAMADEELFDTLDGECALTDALAQVIDSAENDRTLCDALGARIKEMQARQKRIEERIEHKREFAATVMESAGIKKLSLPEATVTLTPRPPRTIITDEAALPPAYFTTPDPPAPRVDRRKLAEALKYGEDVPGALLANSRPTITIRRT
jgi:hypothetical protein